MITAYHVQKHADTVLEVLQALAKLLGDKGKPAETALAMARAVLAILVDPEKASDPADIRKAVDLLRDELAAHDAAANAKLAIKFAGKPVTPAPESAFDVSDHDSDSSHDGSK